MIEKLKFFKHQLKRLLNVSYQIKSLDEDLRETRNQVDSLKILLGLLASRLTQQNSSSQELLVLEKDFQVYSQAGDDGIIQFLINNIHIENKKFVEFGVQDYTESNTRFLLINNNWSGLVIDGDRKNIEYIKHDKIYRSHSLKAIEAFITKENINQVISENDFSGELGILSIDIDGNDYWIWESLHSVKPMILIMEYNHRYGSQRACTIPYKTDFVRGNAHYSNIYYGASLAALTKLSKSKGYKLVACNQFGNNAFFIKDCDDTKHIKELTAEEAYVEGKFKEARNREGNLSFINKEEELKILESLPVQDV